MRTHRLVTVRKNANLSLALSLSLLYIFFFFFLSKTRSVIIRRVNLTINIKRVTKFTWPKSTKNASENLPFH